MLLCARSSHKYYRGLWYDAPHQAPPKWIGMDEVSGRSVHKPRPACVKTSGSQSKGDPRLSRAPLYTAGARVVGDRRCQAGNALERIWSRPITRALQIFLGPRQRVYGLEPRGGADRQPRTGGRTSLAHLRGGRRPLARGSRRLGCQRRLLVRTSP
eukprot:3169840-Prymnesium_polylepis.2